MAKVKTVFVCQNCGVQTPKWQGRCSDCGSWGSFVEEQQFPAVYSGKRGKKEVSLPVPISEVSFQKEERILTSYDELNRVLGGGIVRGEAVLVGGDPGIGKSTLLMQLLADLSKKGLKTLYITGEESVKQIKLRAERIGIYSKNLLVLAEVNCEQIESSVEREKPEVFVIDSIQTLYMEELSSSPGSVSQVRESAGRLTSLAKSLNIPVFFIGHVTKDGMIAGPRVLEHMVDCVLYFEGSKGYSYRILRTYKNRFGSANEIGVFEMSDDGLKEVKNPSALFLSERTKGAAGSIVTASSEGTRTILVEIQSLVSPTTFGQPRRGALGFDPNRANLLIAVLEKKVGLNLFSYDTFINVVGGVRIVEPASDLPVVLAVASSFLDKPVQDDLVAFGEVGLTGEIRAVSQAEARVKEAEKLGFRRIILPSGSCDGKLKMEGVEIIKVKTVKEAIDAALEGVKN